LNGPIKAAHNRRLTWWCYRLWVASWCEHHYTPAHWTSQTCKVGSRLIFVLLVCWNLYLHVCKLADKNVTKIHKIDSQNLRAAKTSILL